jgi:hypothetical protein
MTPVPFPDLSSISSSDIDSASHLLQSLEWIRPPGPPETFDPFPASRFNHRYRSKEPEISGRRPLRNAYLSNT